MRVNDRHVSFYYEMDNDIGQIEIDPKNPRYLKVVWGIGYKMEKMGV